MTTLEFRHRNGTIIPIDLHGPFTVQVLHDPHANATAAKMLYFSNYHPLSINIDEPSKQPIKIVYTQHRDPIGVLLRHHHFNLGCLFRIDTLGNGSVEAILPLVSHDYLYEKNHDYQMNCHLGGKAKDGFIVFADIEKKAD